MEGFGLGFGFGLFEFEIPTAVRHQLDPMGRSEGQGRVRGRVAGLSRTADEGDEDDWPQAIADAAPAAERQEGMTLHS
jgi:hypothetical protein